MPVEVIKYTCRFRCGKKAVGEKSSMAGHEGVCWKNPENKTCKSCAFEVYYKDGDGFRSGMVRGCSNKLVSEEKFEELLSQTEYFTEPPLVHIRPVKNCPFHKIKNKNSNQ